MMGDMVLMIAVLGAFVVGLFFVTRADTFLNRNLRNTDMEKCRKAPSCIVLPDGMSEEEVLKELRQFRSTHTKTCIMMYDSGNMDGVEERVRTL